MRELVRLGHDAKLIAPRYVKPFVKRQKNDAADAEAIVEAAQRPTMRFVEAKTETQQARAAVFRTRELLVNQRTAAINALRAHLFEFGIVVPQGTRHLRRIEEMIADEGNDLSPLLRATSQELLELVHQLGARIEKLTKQIAEMSEEAETARRLRTMPGVGAIGALAIETFAPPMETFASGRAFAAWLGLVPTQHSTGGKQRLGRTSKKGQRDIRRLLIIGGGGAMGVAQGRAGGVLARAHAGAEAAHAGRDRAGQQDGAQHLGHADARRGLSGSGDASRMTGRAPADRSRSAGE